MSDDTIPQTVLFPDPFDRPVVATFDQAHASSDGGAILLKAADARLGLIEALTACLTDGRVSTRVAHTLQDLVRNGCSRSRAATPMPTTPTG